MSNSREPRVSLSRLRTCLCAVRKNQNGNPEMHHWQKQIYFVSWPDLTPIVWGDASKELRLARESVVQAQALARKEKANATIGGRVLR